MKKLGFGLMRLPVNDPTNPADVDIEQVKKIACGQCEGVCPQHLPIIEKLRDVSAHFDHA